LGFISQQQQQQQQTVPTKTTTQHQETKTHSLSKQTNAAVLIQKVFRGRRVRKDSPVAKLSTLNSTQKAANELFSQAQNENILEEGHVFDSNTPRVGNVPRALMQLDNELTKLLLVLDSVGSGFSEEVQSIVRSKRKQVAQNIEQMLSLVDQSKKTCVIRPVVEIEQLDSITNTSTFCEPSTDVEMKSVDNGEEESSIQTETSHTNALTLSSSFETTITPFVEDDRQSVVEDDKIAIEIETTTNDTNNDNNNNNNNNAILPPVFSSSESIQQEQEEQHPTTPISDTDDWIVLPNDSNEMEITTPQTSTPTPKPSSFITIPSLKQLSYNACDKVIKSVLSRTPAAC